MAITIKDVAAKANVSISTVSKVVNNHHSISDKTAAYVREVMAELDYTPNARARSFKKRSTKTIGFLTALKKGEAFDNPHMFEILCGAHGALNHKGYTVTLIDVAGDEKPGQTAKTVISNQGYDGIILHGSAISRSVAALMARGDFPHIVIGKPEFESQVCWLDTNNVLAGDIAARHLAGRGARHLAFIGGGRQERISLDRLQGVQMVANELGLVFAPGDTIYTDSSVEDSYKAALGALQGENRPDAVVCENNSIAIGTLKAVRDLGLDMPRVLQLITFDDYPFSRIMDPMPTVVNIDVYELGAQAAALLTKKIKNPAMQVQSFTTLPEVIQRTTTRL